MRSALCLLLLTLCAAILACGQSTNATLSGIVVDPADKAIPGVEIQILNEATGVCVIPA